MKKVRKVVSYIALVLAILLIIAALLPALSAKAGELEDLQKTLDDVSQKLNNLEAQNKALDKNINNAVKTKKAADEEINFYMQKIEVTNKLISVISTQLKEQEKRLEEKEKEYVNNYQNFKNRIRFWYEQGNSTYFEVIVNAKSFSDLITRVDTISAIMRYDNKVVENIKANIAEIRLVKTGIENDKAKQESLKAQLNVTKNTQQNKSNSASSELNKALTNKEINEKLEKEYEAQQESLWTAIWAKMGSDALVSGSFMWPLGPIKGTITSPYGNRKSPITGRAEFHTGVDIGIGYGTSIYASNSGKVVFSGVNGGYGNCIIVDHGGGMATLYAHASSLAVKDGTVVKKGDLIAKVGSTGNSTGNHLHFEVRQGSQRLNPLLYVKQP